MEAGQSVDLRFKPMHRHKAASGLYLGEAMRVPFVCCTLLTLLNLGCQSTAPLAAEQLNKRQPFLDFSGLGATQVVNALKVRATPPEKWDCLPLKTTSLYTHGQWRSPSHSTGVGVAYIHLPIPLPLKTLLWFAQKEYTKRSDDGKLLNQWTDGIGRTWFEAENKLYHLKGYAVINGTDAWFVYYGYKMTRPASSEELILASKALDTIIPQVHPGQDLQASAGPAPSTPLVR